jgi:hypothetical protein
MKPLLPWFGDYGGTALALHDYLSFFHYIRFVINWALHFRWCNSLNAEKKNAKTAGLGS